MTIEIISSFMNFTMLMCRFYDALILPHLININKLRPENTLNAPIPKRDDQKGGIASKDARGASFCTEKQ